MKRATLLTLLLCIAGHAYSAELATCRSPVGKSYFHYSGLTDKKGSGWTDDKIGNAVFTLTQADDGTFDVLYVDVRGNPISSSQDGAIVRPLRKGASSISVLVFYPSNSTEIYTFFTEKDGSHKVALLQSRNGDGAIVPKSTLLVGPCEPIRFDLMK